MGVRSVYMVGRGMVGVVGRVIFLLVVGGSSWVDLVD